MKNLKKFLAVLLAVAVMATMIVPVFADSSISEDAKLVSDLGVLKGDGSGVNATYLAKGTTRLQAAILYLRLIGKETAALSYTGTEKFADQDKLTWVQGRNILSYLKANPALGWLGYTDGTFRPNDPITAQMLYKVMLEGLGFKQGVDFEWKDVISFAASKGLSKIASVLDVTNDNVATALVETLKATAKDGKVLVEKLIADGMLDANKASVLLDLKIVSFKPVGAKKLEVAFNKAVDTEKAVFAINRGTVVANVDSVKWNDAKTTATIELVSKFIAGEYTVKATGIELKENSAKANVEAEKVASIQIPNEIAPLENDLTGVTFGFSVKNQYGEDMTSLATLNWTASIGTLSNVSTGVKKLTASLTKDQTIIVTALHPETGVFASKTMKVGDPARVATINSVSLYHAEGKTLKTNSNFGEFFIKVDALDQYGNKVTPAQLNSGVTVVISNPSVITKASSNNFGNDGMPLVQPINNVAGSSVVTVISNFTGQSKSMTVTVEAPASLDVLTLQVPTDLVVKGEKVKIPFNAFDQFGKEMSETDKAAIANNVLTSTDPNITFSFSYNYETKKAELTLDATNPAVTPGNKVIMAVTPTGKVSQITVDVKDTARPVAVSAIKDLVTRMTVGAQSTISPSNIVVIDQYGRTMKLDTTWFTNYKLAFATSDFTKVVLSDAEIAAESGNTALSGVATGNSTISITIKKVSDNSEIANSKFDFVASTVAKSAIASYVVELPESIYRTTSHAKDLKVYGKTSSDAKVALATSDFSVTTNNTNVTYASGKIQANIDPWAYGDASDVAVTVIVVIDGANGPETITKTLKVMKADPVVEKIEVDATKFVQVLNVNAAGLIALFKGKDQYGFDKTLTVTNVVISNVSGTGLTITNNGSAAPSISGAAAGQSFTVTIVADGGKTASTNVVVVP